MTPTLYIVQNVEYDVMGVHPLCRHLGNSIIVSMFLASLVLLIQNAKCVVAVLALCAFYTGFSSQLLALVIHSLPAAPIYTAAASSHALVSPVTSCDGGW